MKKLSTLLMAFLLVLAGISANAQAPGTINIIGQVVQPSGGALIPVANTTVYLYPDTNSMAGGITFQTLLATTNVDGYYVFRDTPRLAPGQITDYVVFTYDCRQNRVSQNLIADTGSLLMPPYLIVCPDSVPPVTTTIQLSGRIISIDANGVFSPLANYPVSLIPGQESISAGNNFSQMNTTSDASGTYHFTVPYNATPTSVTRDYEIFLFDCRQNRNARTATATSTLNQSGLDLVGCPAPDPIVGTLKGFVSANNSYPQNAVVLAWQLGSDYSAFTNISSADSGYYYFNNLPAGRYIVQAYEYGNTVTTLPTYAPSTTDWANAGTFAVISGTASTADITLVNADGTSGRDSLSGTLTGDSVTSNFRVAYTMSVNYERARIILKDAANGTDRYSTAVNTNGTWAFGNLPAGNYKARVEYPKVSSSEVNVTVPASEGVHFVVSGGNIVNSVSKNVDAKLVSLFPNPATSALEVRSPGFDISKAVIVNSVGQSIAANGSVNGSSLKMNIEGIAPGVYTLQLEGANGSRLFKKFVKQ
ncbi:MAG: T9SS type A sorting domain-containing protein [Bacteroidota bacterium]